MSCQQRTLSQLVNGTGLMILSVACFALMDVSGKWLCGSYPLLQVLLFRMGVTVLFTGALVLCLGERRRHPHPVRLGLPCLYGVSWAITALLFATAFSLGDLTRVYLVSFLHPIFLVILLWLIRGQRTRPSALLPLGVMFLGVVCTVSDTDAPAEAVPAALVCAGLAGCFYAMNAILATEARSACNGSNWGLLFYGSLSASLLLAAVTAVAGIAGESIWVTPSSGDTALLLAQGLVAGLANLLLLMALARAGARAIMPLDYSIVAFGAGFDWLLFDVPPSLGLLVGGLIIVGGGIWHVCTEQENGPQCDETDEVQALLLTGAEDQ